MSVFTLRSGPQHCPAHQDRTASLSVTQGEDGRWLLHCHAGCTQDEVVTAAGLTWADLFPPGSTRPPALIARRRAPHVKGLDPEILTPLVEQADRTRHRLAPYWPIFYRSDEVRGLRRAAQDARDLAAKYPAIEWDLLDQAVHLDTQADDLEATLEDVAARLTKGGAR